MGNLGGSNVDKVRLKNNKCTATTSLLGPFMDLTRVFDQERADCNLQKLEEEYDVSHTTKVTSDDHDDDGTWSLATVSSGNQDMEKKIITIVFWDIHGFSALCYSLEAYPILLTSFLKDFFDAATPIILKHGGIVDKFLGDGLMALFGAKRSPYSPVRNSAVCAIIAALELRKEFTILRQKWKEIWQRYIPSRINLGLKCGINTGYASVGKLGSKHHDNYTAFGVNVNLTKRLVDLSDENEIVISLTTRSNVAGQFALRRKDTVNTLKNIPGSFEIFSVIGKRRETGK